jgi:hypothetical protein
MVELNTRLALSQDRDAIVALFQEDGNRHGWNREKWNHYYLDYPDGSPVGVVLEASGRIVGHYGMLPVRIAQHRPMLGLHAYISADCRGINSVAKLMKAVDDFCLLSGVPFICGFSNAAFTEVKTRLFKWRIATWLTFARVSSFDLDQFAGRTLRFAYSAAWFRWRFGAKRTLYLSRYERDGRAVLQLLKCGGGAINSDEPFECWHPERYSIEEPTELAQPFCIKCYDLSLDQALLCSPENWFIEMGDSDSFAYSPA